MIKIAILNYPQALKSAFYGLEELFLLANSILEEDALDKPTLEQGAVFNAQPLFDIDLINWATSEYALQQNEQYHAVIIPPSLGSSFYLQDAEKPESQLNQWLIAQHQNGAILSSACAGAFILANTGLLEGRPVTTHWQLSQKLKDYCPVAKVKEDKILINDKDIITAGGIMAWLDLGLELVSVLASPALMRQLGKQLVVDTGHREQAYYQVFKPNKHTDSSVLTCQHYIQMHYQKSIKIAELAKLTHLTERTLLRRFQAALSLSPSEYIQNTRIQKACDLLESSHLSVETIAIEVGYSDTSAYRKAFKHKMGLSPSQFRQRFAKKGLG
jgi:transcriptional regulator GlxA family with amidase domain